MAVVSIPCYFDAQMPRDYFIYDAFWLKGCSPLNLVPYYVRPKPANVLISLLKPPKESRLYLESQDCREVSISWFTDLVLLSKRDDGTEEVIESEHLRC